MTHGYEHDMNSVSIESVSLTLIIVLIKMQINSVTKYMTVIDVWREKSNFENSRRDTKLRNRCGLLIKASNFPKQITVLLFCTTCI